MMISCYTWRRPLTTIIVLTVLICGEAIKSPIQETGIATRPSIVTDALKGKKRLYYFAVGSNLLRSKVENRSVCGSKINIVNAEAAVVRGFRLAFNMRGFPPLEPGMGSLEPIEDTIAHRNSTSQSSLYYSENECHGALYLLEPEDYERVMQSEGIRSGDDDTPSSRNGYEEIIVSALPYGENRAPVQAVSLRARSHARLHLDPCPSHRYMEILREGAMELQLSESYQLWLRQMPVQRVPKLLQRIAVRNILWTFFAGQKMKWLPLSKIQSWILFQVYVPSSSQYSMLSQHLSNLIMGLILLPGSIVGAVLLEFHRRTNKLSPMMTLFIDYYG